MLPLPQVYSIEHDSLDGITTLAFHPYHPLLICADSRGFIKVSNFQDSTLANAFHVASGAHVNHAAPGAPAQWYVSCVPACSAALGVPELCFFFAGSACPLT